MLMVECKAIRATPGTRCEESSSTHTLPTLLDQGCDHHPNTIALNDWHNHQWTPLSNLEFRHTVELMALGFQDLGLTKGDRIALLMESDSRFCIADMGCLLAGCVSVPIDLTQTIENIIFILQHSGAKALIVSRPHLLEKIAPFLTKTPAMEWVLTPSPVGRVEEVNPPLSLIPESDPRGLQEPWDLKLPLRWRTLDDVRKQGLALNTPAHLTQFREAIQPTDLATIVYIAGEHDRPKGVMLSHGAIASTILSAFSVYPDLGKGSDEVVLSFLPLTHIFARSFIYGHFAYGHSIYFSIPSRVAKHLKQIQPTIFITVPRLLEKVYSKIVEHGQKLTRWQRWLFDWSLHLAQRYELGRSPQGWYWLQLTLADCWVFSKWRSPFGGRLKALISGGAALDGRLANVLSAAGLPICQGYGLTETSGVLSYGRGASNLAGSVGQPIPGVEVAIALDGEILVKSVGNMVGYYDEPELTAQVLDAEGWLHTGDLGRITNEGLLEITGVKKSLFKLATGKYISAAVLEDGVKLSPLVMEAIAVGVNRKFCAMLIWPNLTTLRHHTQILGFNIPPATLMHHPCVMALYQSLIDEANCHLPTWSTVKRFTLIETPLTTEHNLISSTGTLNRAAVLQRYAADIDELYTPPHPQWTHADQTLPLPINDCPLPPFTCPTYAQSLTHY